MLWKHINGKGARSVAAAQGLRGVRHILLAGVLICHRDCNLFASRAKCYEPKEDWKKNQARGQLVKGRDLRIKCENKLEKIEGEETVQLAQVRLCQ